MTQEGFEEYIYAVKDVPGSGTANSYIKAIRIIDEMFAYDDVFALHGKSITCIDDSVLLKQIVDFVYEQQLLYKKGEKSIFRNVKPSQVSYPGKGYCSAAVRQLHNYHKYNIKERGADTIVTSLSNGAKVSKQLITYFDLDKKGNEMAVKARARVGQHYFRKMVLSIYDSKCALTGIDVPELLSACHIKPWSNSKKERMNPENGICLTSLYHECFDLGFIGFDKNYKVVLSQQITEKYNKAYYDKYFGFIKEKKLYLPENYKPNPQFLEWHMDEVFRR